LGVLQKAGMKYEGTLKQYIIHKDEFDDCIIYAAIRNEWEGKSGMIQVSGDPTSL
jgi:RimJ/RimL family protein N-acetyltransferase